MLTNRLIRHGKSLLQYYIKRDIYTTILEHSKYRTIPNTIQKVGGQHVQKVALRNNNGIFRFGQHARKLFIDNILNRVTTTYSADLRIQATKKLFYGDSAPFFALIGVSLASGAGVLTKEDELEGVCWEIREAATRVQQSWNKEDISETLDDDFDIDHLEVGPPIAKGCAAVVYAAAFKTNDVVQSFQKDSLNIPTPTKNHKINTTQHNYSHEMMSPIQNISRFVHNFGGSVDNLYIYNQRTSVDKLFDKTVTPPIYDKKNKNISDNSDVNKDIILSVNSTTNNMLFDISALQENTGNICRYPLALKMMFNYDIQSNALCILRAMYKETVPARRRISNQSENESQWEKHYENQTLMLSPHPNIVTMYGYFCGEVRNFRDGHILYPVAQPPRINPQGYGRNMSLYLLMKRYDCSLRSILDGSQLHIRARLLLFAQLLEAVAHLSRHGVAHRDLKSDNILIEQNDDKKTPPLLVLSDFGCCLADKHNGLQIPYSSFDIDKGGNAALMAPEIINKNPGPFAFLDYSKSDLWACGAIGYEIFGQQNPFYSSDKNTKDIDTKSLKNFNYIHCDLPPLNEENCPTIVQYLIHNILNPNPAHRLSSDVAANVMQLYLWAPSNWLKSGGTPSNAEVLQWLLSLTTKLMCEGRLGNTNKEMFKVGRRTSVEYILICSFLSRARLRRIRGALSWIQSVV